MICSDGDLMEGVSSEAASLAGHLKLGKIIYCYDDNRISIDGSTELAFTEDRAKRFEAYGWQVQRVEDGNDVEMINNAIIQAKADPRPSLIVCRTHIGYGLPTRQDTAKAHGEPPGVEELKAAKQNLDWPVEPDFYVPEDVKIMFEECGKRGKETHRTWEHKVSQYAAGFSVEWTELKQRMNADYPDNWEDKLPVFQADAKGMATSGVLKLKSNNDKEVFATSDRLRQIIISPLEVKTWRDLNALLINQMEADNKSGMIMIGIL